ncbi:Hsp20/alpha crystallin family protein [Asanoa sp. WMMD1127]|uniref:Hsp20/alpha crystallin family protein n=1 Tax=Asanoa sp. WMMD1127 TaxID=3016107 RepID=UPI002416816E|nr:Hsp20/alpha crystallin family protein [Asanoa sp. WMMD1127]MDG4824974.1 Hsp20/alpha crystallin family protein [Asanoa sp. WMMD1127]
MQRRGGGQVGWDPYRDANRFDQLVRTLFADAPGLTAQSALAIPVDIEETDDAYVVDVDLPNVNPDDVTIEMRGEELRISGRFEQRERSGVMRRQNRQQGEFEYVVDLPSDLDPDRVDATYDRGVLRISVPKAQDAQPRRIEIHETQGGQQAS